MKKQNDNALILAAKVIETKAKNSNLVFSPASINSAITMHAAGPDGDLDAGGILSYLRSSSLDELKAVFSEISTVVLANNSSRDSPKISAANGLWIDKSLAIDPKYKKLFENFFKAFYAKVDFRSKVRNLFLICIEEAMPRV
ncbi:unnamed protein product [Arabis nemorensis]|uniref:Serpin domain-containing protein n=1 Tax=Arabis nemorensis TaxID=586526 RepID=A0A565CA79_9BRAS|nr:unnamed protein product [Arabis nemorensis]